MPYGLPESGKIILVSDLNASITGASYLTQVILELKDEVKALRNVTRELERQIDRMGPDGIKADAAAMEVRIKCVEDYKTEIQGSIKVWKMVVVALWSVTTAMAGFALARTH